LIADIPLITFEAVHYVSHKGDKLKADFVYVEFFVIELHVPWFPTPTSHSIKGTSTSTSTEDGHVHEDEHEYEHGHE